MANARPKRVLGCAPADRIAADTAAMLTLPPVPPVTGWRQSLRLARDHYVRLDSNDYSVHPAVIGRRIEVTADLLRVRAWCDGRLVADHDGSGRGIRPSPTPRIWPPRRRCAGTGPGPPGPLPSPRSSSAAWPTTTPRWAPENGVAS